MTWPRLDLPSPVPRGMRTMSGSQWLLRGAVAVAVLLGVVAVDAAVDGMPWVWMLLVVAAGGLAVIDPDSGAPGWTLLLLGAGWGFGVERGQQTSGWLLVLAASMVVVHVGSALVSSGPPGASFGRRAVGRWLRGSVIVLAIAFAAWAGLLALDAASPPASTVRLVAALVAVAWLAWFVRAASLDPRDPDE